MVLIQKVKRGFQVTQMEDPLTGKPLKWMVTIQEKRTSPKEVVYMSREDWMTAVKQTLRKDGEGDFRYRCRAWSAYLGRHVVDWEDFEKEM